MKIQLNHTTYLKLLFSFFALVFSISIFSCSKPSAIKITDLKCEYRTNPLGIDNTTPRFSWKLTEENKTRGQKQTAYKMLVASSLDNLDNNIGDVWDSGKVESNQSVNNTYAGGNLESSKQYFWKVKVWDVSGQESGWSDTAHFSMGLLNKDDWKGEWIYKKDQNKNCIDFFFHVFKLKQL